MIQKKVCMVGVYGTGKTSLVQRYVHTMFSERYLSTVGVKIDRKALDLDGTLLDTAGDLAAAARLISFAWSERGDRQACHLPESACSSTT